MRPIYVRTISASVLALLAFAAGAAAQEKTSPGILTRNELRDLAATADTPLEHLQLRNHFTALAERYDVDAKRYSALAKAYVGNQNRRTTDPTIYREQLSLRAAAAAKSARALAAHHGRLAAGVPSTAPADPQHLEHGTGAPATMSDAKLRDLVAKTSTPADHGKLQDYFTTAAARYTADADAHSAMAAAYRSRGSVEQVALRCDRFVAQARETAAAAQSLAAEHQALATVK